MTQTATAEPPTLAMRDLTYAQALNEALGEEMERDSRVVLLGEDIGFYGGTFTVTKGLWERFGDHVVDRPHPGADGHRHIGVTRDDDDRQRNSLLSKPGL